MPNRLLIAALVAVTPFLAMSRLAAPVENEAGCVLAMHGARSEQRSLMSMMRSRSLEVQAKLRRYKVDGARPSEVELVTDDEVCAQAATAYGSVVRDTEPDRHVTVLQVRDRFVVRDPEFKPDKHRRAVTFDSTFTEPLAVVVE